MRILLDTNVVLDVLLDREPHVRASSAILAAVEAGLLTGLLGATSVTTIHYLASKAVGSRRARRHTETLLSLCEIAPVNADVLRDALGQGFKDYEDAVLHEAARAANAMGIVTRDRGGFSRASLPIYSPEELLASLRAP